MEKLPEILLQFISEFLTIKEIFGSFNRVCKVFNSLFDSPYFLNRLLSFQINTCHQPTLSLSTCLSSICEIQKKIHFKSLKFEGFGTTGGVDDDLPCYWVTNLFRSDSSSYCSRFSRNINCVAVLEKTQAKEIAQELIEARALAARMIRKNHLLSTITQAKYTRKSDLLPIEERIFIEAWEQNRAILDLSTIRDSDEAKNNAYRVIKANQLKPASYSKDTEQALLIKDIDHASVSQFNCVACVNKVFISREGEYSCPVSAFVVFMSDEYIEITSNVFALYNSISSYEKLLELTELDKSIPKVYPLHSSKHFEYSIFRASRRDLKPLVWGKFKSARKELVSVPLDEIFSGRYLYVKLISSDNRMEEFHDHHDSSNIDCTYIGVHGTEVKIR